MIREIVPDLTSGTNPYQQKESLYLPIVYLMISCTLSEPMISSTAVVFPSSVLYTSKKCYISSNM